MALTKFNFNSFDLTTVASTGLAFNASANGFDTAAAGSMTLIKTTTASGVGNVDLTHGSNDVVLDGTYDTYLFKLINIHVSAQCEFAVNFSTDGGSSYGVTLTSTAFDTYHMENASASALRYLTGGDLAQSTSFQPVTSVTPNTDNDASYSGYLHLFDPSNTTFVKHFIARSNTYYEGDSSIDSYTGGYCNVTAAIDGVDFKFSSGNIDSGVIKMYGVL